MRKRKQEEGMLFRILSYPVKVVSVVYTVLLYVVLALVPFGFAIEIYKWIAGE